MFDFEEFYKSFHLPYEKSTEIDNLFAEYCNKQGLRKGIEYLQDIGATWLDIDSYTITYLINEYTKEPSTIEEQQLIDKLKKLKDTVIDVRIKEEKNKKQIIILTKTGTLKFIKFSSLTPRIKEELPILTTSNRAGKCFELSYEINRRLGIPHTIVTGFIHGYSDMSRYLHTWLELNYNGETYVIDGTLNAMITKEEYYKLKHIKIINRIQDDTFQSDLENNLDKLKGLPLEIYFVYRDEIINDETITLEKLSSSK